MDRFIETIVQLKRRCQIDLKSNMDRFIVFSFSTFNFLRFDLKSNMDRFIDHKIIYLIYLNIF